MANLGDFTHEFGSRVIHSDWKYCKCKTATCINTLNRDVSFKLSCSLLGFGAEKFWSRLFVILWYEVFVCCYGDGSIHDAISLNLCDLSVNYIHHCISYRTRLCPDKYLSDPRVTGHILSI